MQRAVELLGDDTAGAAISSAAIASLDPAPRVVSSSQSSEAVIASCLQGQNRIDISGKYLAHPQNWHCFAY